MAEPTPESSYDAVKYVAGQMRVVWAVLAAVSAPAIWAGTHLYDTVIWVERNRAHEEAQDAKAADFEVKFKLADLDRDNANRRSNERVSIVMGELDSIRFERF